MRAALAERAGTPVVWDPHPRGPAPVPGVLLATPNLAEARALVPDSAGDGLPARRAARRAARRWDAAAVCVTRGAHGALLDGGDGPPLAVPADPVVGGDRAAPVTASPRAAAALAAGPRPTRR